MTRPRAYPAQQRIITDLTYPKITSVNACIRKNTVMGVANTHSLPTVDALVDRILQLGPGAFMFTIDVTCAYKNFKSCHFDWPLLAIKWKKSYYLDITMPFDARASSGHMQRVADAIVAIFAKKNIIAHMYLDDLVVVALTEGEAAAQYHVMKELLAELGLPEALDKAQPPTTCIKWLGINVDLLAGTLTVPDDKVKATRSKLKAARSKLKAARSKLKAARNMVEATIKRRSITGKQLQAIIGKLLHVAKCV